MGKITLGNIYQAIEAGKFIVCGAVLIVSSVRLHKMEKAKRAKRAKEKRENNVILTYENTDGCEVYVA